MNRTRLLTLAMASAAVVHGAAAQTAPRELTLGEAARLAAQQSPSAMAARYHTDELAARARTVHAAMLPDVSGGWMDAQRSFNTASFGIPFPGFDPNGSIIGPVRTIDFRGRVNATLYNPAAISEYRSAQAAVTRADADAAAAVDAATGVAAAAYIRAVRAEAQVSSRSADSSLAFDLLDIARTELGAGTGVALDVTRAQAQLAKVRAQLIGARNERDRARLELLRATGLPLTTVLVLRDSLGGPLSTESEVDAESAISQALRGRADLRAAADARDATARAEKATHNEWRPSVGVFGDEGVTAAKYSYLKNTYTYGLQLSIPIFEGHRNESRTAERDAVLRAADLRQHDLETQVAVQVRSALLDLASAREQLGAARDGLAFAEQAVTQARDRFTTGVAGSGDVISAQLDVSGARLLYVDALSALQAARVALARAQGRLTGLP